MNKKIILLSLMSCIFFISKIALSSNPQNVTKQQAAHSSASSIDQSSSSITYSTASSEAAHTPLIYPASSSSSSSLLTAYTPSSTQPILYDSTPNQALAASSSTTISSRDLRAFTTYSQPTNDLSSSSHKSFAVNSLSSSAAALAASASAQEPSSSSQSSSFDLADTTANTSSSPDNTDIPRKSRLTCSFCSQELGSIEKRNKHQWDRHRADTRYVCNICQYCDSNMISRHFRSKSHQYKVQQSLQANSNSSPITAIAASASAQTTNNSSQSSSFDLTDTTAITSSSSDNTDIPRKSRLTCSFCSQELKSIEKRNKHQWDKHRADARYVCNICQYCDSNKISQHLNSKSHQYKVQQSLQANPNSSPITTIAASASAQAANNSSQSSSFDLTNTTANASSSSNNTRILKSHIKCLLCSHKFESEEDRDKHQWDEHQNETNFNCNNSQLSYKHNSSFASHMKMHAAQAAACEEEEDDDDYDETAQQESALKDGYAIKNALSLRSVLATLKQYGMQRQAAQTLALLSQSNANETVQLSSSSSSSAAAITTSAAAMPSSSSAISVDKVKGTKRKASHTDGTASDKNRVKKRKQK